MIQKWVKKPVVVEALQFDGNELEVVEFTGGRFKPGEADFIESLDRKAFAPWVIETPNGDVRVSHGEWIIKGVEGEFYPCADSVFHATYCPYLP